MKAAARKSLGPSQLRKLIGSQQVAAVCYRIRNDEIEFLLVNSRGGRWTFPKGGAEPGLTHAQAAALEAFEEAGVHGRIEENPFASYSLRKRAGRNGAEVVIDAHLCEVTRQGPPQESGRNPTWFSPSKAKKRLQKDRKEADGGEFASIIDRAVMRIYGSRNESPAPAAVASKDPLQKVQFEASEGFGSLQSAAYVHYAQRTTTTQQSAELEVAIKAFLGKVLRPQPKIRTQPARVMPKNPPFLIGGFKKQPATLEGEAVKPQR